MTKRRDQSKAETREALLRAALASYAAIGLDGESLDAVCRRADLTRGALYVHFADRDALLEAVMSRILDEFLATIIRSADGARDLEATIRGFTDLLIALRERPDLAVAAGVSPFVAFGAAHFYLVLAAVQRSARVQARFAELIDEASRRLAAAAERGQRAGDLRDDVAAAPAGAALVALALGFMALHQANVAIDLLAAREAILALAMRQR